MSVAESAPLIQNIATPIQSLVLIIPPRIRTTALRSGPRCVQSRRHHNRNGNSLRGRDTFARGIPDKTTRHTYHRRPATRRRDSSTLRHTSDNSVCAQTLDVGCWVLGVGCSAFEVRLVIR